MNKTININLAGIVFYVDETAYNHFSKYLASVKNQFVNTEERDEIIADIEARIAELFQQKLSSTKQVISMADVEEVIAVMGQPEDYKGEDGEQEETSTANQSNFKGPKRLFRNPDDKIFGGVSSGIAAYFGIDTIWVRLAWVALIFGAGTGFLLYIILWIVMPEAKTTAQKLQMRGEPINIDNIERTVKEEVRNMEARFDNFTKGGGVQKTGNKLRDTIQEIVQAVLQVLRFVLTFVLKAVGVALMLVGFVLLLAIFSLFLGNAINLNGVNIDYANLMGYLQATLPSDMAVALLTIGIMMLIMAPIIWVILLSLRILFNYKKHSRYSQISLGIVSTVGIILIISVVSFVAMNFAEQATYSETIELGGTNHFAMRVTDNIDDERTTNLDWSITNKAQIIGFVYMDVLKTTGDHAYIELKLESRGKNQLEARKRARNYTYFLEKQDTIVNLANYFTLPLDEKFRAQKLRVNVYLPVGSQIFLDESTVEILKNVQNVSNTWDFDMVNHTWIMTQNGLACLDCKQDDTKWKSNDEWSDFDKEFENEAKAFDGDEKARLEEAEKKLKEAQKEIEALKKKK